MLLVSQAIVSELVQAQEKGLSVNLNDIRVKQCKKLKVTGMPKLVDIIAAIPEEHKKTLLPMLKARPIRSASGVSVEAVSSFLTLSRLLSLLSCASLIDALTLQ